jgi:PAS domain-containing protein
MSSVGKPVGPKPIATATSPRPTSSRWIECDARTLQENFDRTPFALRHRIVDEPLFNMDGLTNLARFLESRPGEVYVDVGVSHVGQRWDQAARPILGVAELIHELAETDAWIILRKPELDPAYRLLLDQCLSELRELMGGDWGRPTRRDNSIIFITSPRRLSTYHIDRECNFILQISGEKTLFVFDQNDRDVLPEKELERFWAVDHNAARYRPEYQDRAKVFRLRPGDGVHVPVNAPHWVQNDDNVSVTLSVNFQFSDADRASQYRANHYLRKLGINPSPPGKYPWRDRLKASTLSGAGRLWKLVRRLDDDRQPLRKPSRSHP